jgi:hypothetical protein
MPGLTREDFFEDLKRRSWDALNSYTHIGMLQLGRRISHYFLVSKLLAVQNHADECRGAEALVGTYGPAP